MNLFFKSDKLTLPKQVLKNKNDIETLKENGFIVNPTGAYVEDKIYKKFDLVAFQDDAYIYINNAESQGINPTNNEYWSLYSSAQEGPQGPQGPRGQNGTDGWGFNNATLIDILNDAISVDNNGINLSQTMRVTAEQQVGNLPPSSAVFDIETQTRLPIVGSESIVVDVAEDGEHAEIHLDAEITNKLAKTLVTPMSTPTETEIVAVDNTNSQTMLAIGDGLSVENGTLKSSGGSKLYRHIVTIGTGTNLGNIKMILYTTDNQTLTKQKLAEKIYFSGVSWPTFSSNPLQSLEFQPTSSSRLNVSATTTIINFEDKTTSTSTTTTQIPDTAGIRDDVYLA